MATVQVEKRGQKAAGKAILNGLIGYNARMDVPIKRKPLVVSLREDQEIVGGLVADTYLEWLHVHFFWVADAYRGQDFGTRLLKHAETEAYARGARRVWLETYEFQAPDFYRKLGFQEFGRIDKFVGDHGHFWLMKPIEPATI